MAILSLPHVLTLNVQGPSYLGLLGQHHGCWCPGSLRHQDISSHDIDCIEYLGPSLAPGRILSTCVISMWKNDTKCKYMFMFPLKNLARKGLSKLSLKLGHGWVTTSQKKLWKVITYPCRDVSKRGPMSQYGILWPSMLTHSGPKLIKDHNYPFPYSDIHSFIPLPMLIHGRVYFHIFTILVCSGKYDSW